MAVEQEVDFIFKLLALLYKTSRLSSTGSGAGRLYLPVSIRSECAVILVGLLNKGEGQIQISFKILFDQLV